MVFYICEAASFDRGFDQQDKAMNLIDVSEIQKDIDASGYGCESTDWQESLGYMVADNKLTQDYLTDLLMQYLGEVSFFGMDPARRTERLNEVRQSLDQSMLDAENDKGIPAEEFMKQMANKYGWPNKEEDQRQDELKGKMIEAEMEYLSYCHRRERQRILNGLVDQKPLIRISRKQPISCKLIEMEHCTMNGDGRMSESKYLAKAKELRANHEGMLDCADLLRQNKELGGEKKPHCDGLVFECVSLVEEFLRNERQL